ncbi:MAG: hypothetical protein IKR85_03135 [Clostridia bacterium]|nr:hypothetical protein [Clostridia bacterium]
MIIIAVMLVHALLCTAAADIILPTFSPSATPVPTPEPTPAPSPEFAHTIDGRVEWDGTTPLPDLGEAMACEGTLYSEVLDLGEFIGAGYLYNCGSLTDDAISQYASVCRKAGFKFEGIWLGERYVYEISAAAPSGETFKAILMNEFDGTNPLLVVQNELPFELYTLTLSNNQMLLTLNGSKYLLDFVSMTEVCDKTGREEIFNELNYSFTSYYSDHLSRPSYTEEDTYEQAGRTFRFESMGLGTVSISIPCDAKTGKYESVVFVNCSGCGFSINDTEYLAWKLLRHRYSESRFQANNSIYSWSDGFWYKVWFDEYSMVAEHDGFQSLEDYFSIDVKNAANSAYNCTFRGSFNNGSIEVSGQFRYVQSDLR